MIKLHPCLSEDTFKLQRCAPNMSNIEQDWFMGEAAKEDESNGEPPLTDSLTLIFFSSKPVLSCLL